MLGFTWPGVKADAAGAIVLGEVERQSRKALASGKIGWAVKSFLTGLTNLLGEVAGFQRR